ncbi:hypothetical protein GCM10018781_04660 [Kitasatospora indigofera]|uniref:Uncharacterized protein n=1 Tax=Kitasatospora indigofera TaxID=67307 RepID=A0A919FBN9_9ACTN|nr:hypothetical protein GCM10018781_04660 [Kitasatospora indigofera]
MSAVTVDNPLTLPRVATPDPAANTPRPVRTVVTAPEGFEGEGFPVRRAFAKINTKSDRRRVHPQGLARRRRPPRRR